MKQIFQRSVTVLLVCSMLACSTTKGIDSKDATSADCLALSVWGGVVGAVLSGRKDAFKGAVAGAGIGMAACLLVKSTVRQTKTAAQVEQSVRSQNRGQLPAQPSVSHYTLSVSPAARLNREGVATIHSNVEVVNGAQVAAKQVREEIVLTAPDGQQKTIARDEFKERTGGFQKVTELKLNPNLLEGLYNIQSNLYINNLLVSTRTTALELVHNSHYVPNIELALHVAP